MFKIEKNIPIIHSKNRMSEILYTFSKMKTGDSFVYNQNRIHSKAFRNIAKYMKMKIVIKKVPKTKTFFRIWKTN